VKYPRDSFFSKGERQATIRIREVSQTAGLDELYPRRHKLHLAFDLPRGSYATILDPGQAFDERGRWRPGRVSDTS
jgi:tRNA pseudouridine13 synthase